MQVHWTNDHRTWYREVYLKSDHWLQLRKAKLEQHPDCQKCCKRKATDVHHYRYRNIFDVQLGDLLFLCRKCHNEIHATHGMPVRPRPKFQRLELSARQAIFVHNGKLKADRKQLKPKRSKGRRPGRVKYANKIRTFEIQTWFPSEKLPLDNGVNCVKVLEMEDARDSATTPRE